MRSWKPSLWAGLLLLAWICLSPSRAIPQSPGTGSPPAASETQPDPDDPEQDFRFGVEIEVVTVPVTVTNSSGEFVTDLNKSDFTVLDNGARQRIEEFELSWDPLSMVIAVETSSRVEPLLPEVQRSGILFTQLILGESGEAAVIGFDKEVQLLQNFTDNPDDIEAALRNLKAGGDGVRLSDATARAISLLQRRPEARRKVIVLISEARNTDSSTPPDFVLRGAQQLGITVYTVGLSTLRSMFSRPAEAPSSPFPPGVAARPTPANQPPTPDNQASRGAVNVNMLELIQELVSQTRAWLGANPLAAFAAGTGGAEFSSGGRAELEKAVGRIGEELRNQYLLTYRPDNLDNPGFHSIRVMVSRPGLQARFRPGYMFGGRNQKRPSSSVPGSQPEQEAPPSLIRR